MPIRIKARCIGGAQTRNRRRLAPRGSHRKIFCINREGIGIFFLMDFFVMDFISKFIVNVWEKIHIPEQLFLVSKAE